MNLFDLFVTIGVKDEVSDKVSGIKSTTIAAGHLIADGVKVATRAVVDLGKQAYEGYAEYEQLIGGVDTLFKRQSLDDYIAANKSAGESIATLRKEYESMEQAADVVVKNAQNAYKAAGMNANEYMNTITSFSASLLQSLGGDTAAAAEYGNQAVVDMADNANKMGTDIQMIQNAYQGFAKQNYTMLDNLKLGYGGTKEEMARLIADANAVKEANGEMANLSIDSFADVVEAIHLIQEEMGIAGATAQEADGTISGSAASMKAAWQNLVVGLGDENANVEELLNNFMESVKTFGTNLLPVVKTILTNIGKTLEENGPEMLAQGVVLLAKIALGIVKGIPDLVAKIPEIVSAIGKAFAEEAPAFKQIGADIVRGVWNGILSLAKWIKTKVSDFFSGIVDNVKGVLGIHSPSRVFAGIGENMALGVGEGWGNEYGFVKRNIEKDVDFGVKRYSAANHGVAAVQGSVFGGQQDFAKEIKIVVQSVLDGKVIGETAYQYGLDRQRAYGGAY